MAAFVNDNPLDAAGNAVATVVPAGAAQGELAPVVGQKRTADGRVAGSQGGEADGYAVTLQMGAHAPVGATQPPPKRAGVLDQFGLPAGSNASNVAQQQMEVLAPPLNPAAQIPTQPPGMAQVGMVPAPIGQQQPNPQHYAPRPIGQQQPAGTYMRQPIGQQMRQPVLLGPHNPLLGPPRPHYRNYPPQGPQQLRGWPAPTPQMPLMGQVSPGLGQQNPLLQMQSIPGQNQFLSQMGQNVLGTSSGLMHAPQMMGASSLGQMMGQQMMGQSMMGQPPPLGVLAGLVPQPVDIGAVPPPTPAAAAAAAEAAAAEASGSFMS